jgi:hypothetical protein
MENIDDDDDEEGDLGRCRRSRTKSLTSIFLEDNAAVDAAQEGEGSEDETLESVAAPEGTNTSSSRVLRRREIKALEDGLEYHTAGRCYRQQHAGDRIASTSIDSSDSTSDSDAERRVDTPRPFQLANRHRKIKLLMLGKTSLVLEPSTL